jgi:hypothetical protein
MPSGCGPSSEVDRMSTWGAPRRWIPRLQAEGQEDEDEGAGDAGPAIEDIDDPANKVGKKGLFN